MEMQRLTTFKQVLSSTTWGEVGNKTSLDMLVATSLAFTVVFNGAPGHCQSGSDPTSSIDAKRTPDANKLASSQDDPASPKTSDKAPSEAKSTHSKANTAESGASPKPEDSPDVSTKLSPNHVVKQADDKMSTARKKEVQPLPNFHKVTDYLYRGGEPNPEGMHQLKKMGVKTLIDLRAQTEAAHDEAALAKKLGIKYINMTMTAEAPTKKQVETLLATIDSAKERNEPVLVHCAHGSDRTGCMIGIWRVTRDNWAFDDTYKEMRKYYFGVKYDKLRNAVKERATH
jgi:protein tyrosine phosphatase (PTP) superfamily phosphohydrolase (DUF442 family)